MQTVHDDPFIFQKIAEGVRQLQSVGGSDAALIYVSGRHVPSLRKYGSAYALLDAAPKMAPGVLLGVLWGAQLHVHPDEDMHPGSEMISIRSAPVEGQYFSKVVMS